MEVHLTVQYSVHSTVVGCFEDVSHKVLSMLDWSVHSVVICSLGNNMQDNVACHALYVHCMYAISAHQHTCNYEQVWHSTIDCAHLSVCDCVSVWCKVVLSRIVLCVSWQIPLLESFRSLVYAER